MPGPGHRLAGRYVLADQLGAGGMGVVWRATDEKLDRTVALKVVNQQWVQDPHSLQRFRTEARAMARVHHPNVVTVHDLHDEAGAAFIVMELVEGESLADRLRRGQLPPQRTLELIGQAADALQAAHEREIVHRDVKPSNLLIRGNGTVALTDFGIARIRDDAPVTFTGVFLGTPHYCAPEQPLGDPVTPQSDVYALGVVAYECLTGRRPFDRGDRQATAMARVHEPPPPLPDDVPPATAAIVLRAMARDPADRWSAAAELAAACQSARADLAAPDRVRIIGIAPFPTQVSPPPTTEPEPQPVAQPASIPPLPATKLAPESLPALHPFDFHGLVVSRPSELGEAMSSKWQAARQLFHSKRQCRELDRWLRLHHLVRADHYLLPAGPLPAVQRPADTQDEADVRILRFISHVSPATYPRFQGRSADADALLRLCMSAVPSLGRIHDSEGDTGAAGLLGALSGEMLKLLSLHHCRSDHPRCHAGPCKVLAAAGPAFDGYWANLGKAFYQIPAKHRRQIVLASGWPTPGLDQLPSAEVADRLRVVLLRSALDPQWRAPARALLAVPDQARPAWWQQLRSTAQATGNPGLALLAVLLAGPAAAIAPTRSLPERLRPEQPPDSGPEQRDVSLWVGPLVVIMIVSMLACCAAVILS